MKQQIAEIMSPSCKLEVNSTTHHRMLIVTNAQNFRLSGILGWKNKHNDDTKKNHQHTNHASDIKINQFAIPVKSNAFWVQHKAMRNLKDNTNPATCAAEHTHRCVRTITSTAAVAT